MKTSKSSFLIGIDPDIDKSGVAWKVGDEINLYNLTFFELFEMLKYYKEREVKPMVYIECGFLTKGNWHDKAGANNAYNKKIGEHTGENKQVAKKLCEMMDYLDIPYVKVKPTAHKLNAVSFKAITGISKRTNQDQRDSCMLIWGR